MLYYTSFETIAPKDSKNHYTVKGSTYGALVPLISKFHSVLLNS